MDTKLDYAPMRPLPAQAYFYDPIVKGFDGSFFAAMNGSVTLDGSNNLVINSVEIASFVQFTFGRHRFVCDVVTDPTAGNSRKIGLYNPAGDEQILFEIRDTTTVLHVIDSFGRDLSADVDSDLLTPGTLQTFELNWLDTSVVLKIDGVFAAQVDFDYTEACAPMPLSWYVGNGESDAMLVKSISAFNCGRIN